MWMNGKKTILSVYTFYVHYACQNTLKCFICLIIVVKWLSGLVPEAYFVGLKLVELEVARS